MQSSSVTTRQVTIWMAGDLATAQRAVRDFAFQEGSCFTCTPSKFFYTGGEEDGFAIGLVNYPRFPSTPNALISKAEALARKLLVACNQRTCLLVGSRTTKWIVVEPPGARTNKFKRGRRSVETPFHDQHVPAGFYR